MEFLDFQLQEQVLPYGSEAFLKNQKLQKEGLLMRNVLTVALFCLALDVSAACPVKRPGVLPALPDGAEVSAEGMYKAQLEAEKYLLQASAYMDCQVMNRRQHMELAERLEVFSERYDEEMIKYQVRRNIVAEK